MSTIDDKDKEIEQSREALHKDARGLWQSLKTFFLELFVLPGRYPYGQLT